MGTHKPEDYFKFLFLPHFGCLTCCFFNQAAIDLESSIIQKANSSAHCAEASDGAPDCSCEIPELYPSKEHLPLWGPLKLNHLFLRRWRKLIQVAVTFWFLRTLFSSFCLSLLRGCLKTNHSLGLKPPSHEDTFTMLRMVSKGPLVNFCQWKIYQRAVLVKSIVFPCFRYQVLHG